LHTTTLQDGGFSPEAQSLTFSPVANLASHKNRAGILDASKGNKAAAQDNQKSKYYLYLSTTH
jgi:hypothetical protein